MAKNSLEQLDALLSRIRSCRHCEDHLPLGPRPIVHVASTAKVLIVGQAPGTAVHKSGIPWDDPSGDRLRSWLDCDKTLFYDEHKVAIIPMGFCYPGRGKGGDLPPRKECAELWFDQLLSMLPSIQMTLLIGQYAQTHYLGKRRKKTLTETVRSWREYAPRYFPLVHPSPRNVFWLQKNPWFEEDVVPAMREKFWRTVE